MRNLEAQLTSGIGNQESIDKNSKIKDTISKLRIETENILKNNEKEKIHKDTNEKLEPLVNNTHLMVELELAKIFGVNNTDKLGDDFRQPMTVAEVLSDAEALWDRDYELMTA